MKKRETLLLTLALVGGAAFGAVGIFAASNAGSTIKAGAANAYDCASIHWGMDDETLTGDVDLSINDEVAVKAGGTAGVIPNAVVDGITMTKYEVKTYKLWSHANAIKFSSSSKNSTLVLTFDKDILGCDIYAAGWGTDTTSIKVNGGDSTTIAPNSKIAGSSTVNDVVYDKYSFSFDATNTLTIAATKRLVIGDIALRVAK